jgi:DNA polymerase III epsilon subunit-like protein
MCVIDTETTGLDPMIHEIIQVCVLPLDSNLQPIKDILPFNVLLRPEKPHLANSQAMKIHGISIEQLNKIGIDKFKALDMFDEWWDKLNLPVYKKIAPLGQNWPFDAAFLKQWMGNESFNQYFHYHFRDTCSTALFLNDYAAFHAEAVPFPKVNLKYLCSQLKIENLRAHSAVSDCVATAEVYRQMVMKFPFLSK